jgi:aminoglycoside phosphotransferase (APT) family kinase protein
MTTLATPSARKHDAAHELARVGEALDAHRMAPRLRAALLDGRASACHVLDAKYEPGLRCTVLYQVGDRMVRGDLLDEDSVADEADGPIVAPGVRLYPFPRDPELPALATATDPAALTRVLRGSLPDGGRGLLGCRIQLLRYRPGKRATLGVDLRRVAAHPSDGSGSYVMKAYDDGGKAAAVAAEADALAALAHPGAPLHFAPVRAHIPELSLVVQGRVRGARLDAMLTAGPAAAAALRRVAVALAALHRMPPVGERQRPVDIQLARFAARSARVSSVDAVAGRALAHLAAGLASTAAEVGPGAVGLVHGDCKPSQFLLGDDRRVTVLDLDSCGRADPASDVGTFLATLRQHAARGLLARRTTAAGLADTTRLAEGFLRDYLANTPAADRADLRRRIGWYEAVALERKALRCFARSPWSPLTAVLVDLGRARLRIGGGT